MRLYYPDWQQNKYVDIVDPSLEQFEKAIDGLNAANSPEVSLFGDGAWWLSLLIDDSNERILVLYFENDPASPFYVNHCVVDTQYSESDNERLQIIAANGQDYYPKRFKTVTRDVAKRVALHIFNYKSAPDFVTWTKSNY